MRCSLAEKGKAMTELIDKWYVVNKLIQLENNYQFYKEKWDADVLYRRICELEIGIGKMPGVTDIIVGDKSSPAGWIPVSERLPELHTKVLCCGIKGGRFIAELTTWGKERYLCWDKRNGRGCPTVTHWMPLPQPPKEGE